jgi:hypothetical protein
MSPLHLLPELEGRVYHGVPLDAQLADARVEHTMPSEACGYR